MDSHKDRSTHNAEIDELRTLLSRAEQRTNDPEAKIAACMFRELIRRRQDKPKPHH